MKRLERYARSSVDPEYTGLGPVMPRGPDHGLDSARVLFRFGEIFSEVIPGWPYRPSQRPETAQQ